MSFWPRKIGGMRLLKSGKFWQVMLFATMMMLLGFIPLRTAIVLERSPVPQAILVLNGKPSRIQFAAQLWQSHRHLDIWVSAISDLEEQYYGNIFRQAGIPQEQIHFDRCATDTVTNFTCTVDDFLAKKLEHLYLITSEYHMPRARAIASLVLGSHGIALTFLPVPSGGIPSESRFHIFRDCIRSILWIVFRRTGASLNPRLDLLQIIFVL